MALVSVCFPLAFRFASWIRPYPGIICLRCIFSKKSFPLSIQKTKYSVPLGKLQLSTLFIIGSLVQKRIFLPCWVQLLITAHRVVSWWLFGSNGWHTKDCFWSCRNSRLRHWHHLWLHTVWFGDFLDMLRLHYVWLVVLLLSFLPFSKFLRPHLPILLQLFLILIVFRILRQGRSGINSIHSKLTI